LPLDSPVNDPEITWKGEAGFTLNQALSIQVKSLVVLLVQENKDALCQAPDKKWI